MNFIAHRGLFDEQIGENTIAAFDNAFKHNYIGVEFDIRKTKDNKVVIIHDSFISRVSDGFGQVKSLTYNELLKYNFGKKKIDRIPLLSKVINKYNNKLIMIELKEPFAVEELDLNDNNQYYLSSFHFDYIKNIPKCKKYKKGIINYVLNTDIEIDKIDFIMILDSLITDEIYNFYQRHNIEVIIYGIVGNINKNLDKKIREKIKYVI